MTTIFNYYLIEKKSVNSTFAILLNSNGSMIEYNLSMNKYFTCN